MLRPTGPGGRGLQGHWDEGAKPRPGVTLGGGSADPDARPVVFFSFPFETAALMACPSPAPRVRDPGEEVLQPRAVQVFGFSE